MVSGPGAEPSLSKLEALDSSTHGSAQRQRFVPEVLARERGLFDLTVEVILIQRRRFVPEVLARERGLFDLTVEVILIQRQRLCPEVMARESFDLTVEIILIQRQRILET